MYFEDLMPDLGSVAILMCILWSIDFVWAALTRVCAGKVLACPIKGLGRF